MRTIRAITRTLTVTVTAGLLAAASLAVATPASATEEAGASAGASGGGTTTQDTERADLLRQRAAVACARMPNAVERTEKLQERLAGDEDVRGSLAWLEARAEQVEARGRTELAEALRARIEVRTELAELLPLRLEALESAQALCDEAAP